MNFSNRIQQFVYFSIFIIFLIFSFSVFALTNEEKARKLFVETNLELETNCNNNFGIFQTIIDLSLTSDLSKLKGSYSKSDLSSIPDYQKRLADSITCYNFIKNKFLPTINKIQTKYSTTQVAYDLAIDIQISFLKQTTDQVLTSLLKEKIKIDLIIERKKDEIEKEKIRVKAEIEKENNRIIDCFTAAGIKYEKRNIEGCEAGDFTYNPVPLTEEEIEIVSQQLRDCFNPRAGIQIVGNESITIFAKVDRQANIIKDTVRIKNTNISKSNQYYSAITESALSTFYNPLCSNLNLPLLKYDSWKHLSVTIDYSWLKN